jgi:hypothetical protein
VSGYGVLSDLRGFPRPEAGAHLAGCQRWRLRRALKIFRSESRRYGDFPLFHGGLQCEAERAAYANFSSMVFRSGAGEIERVHPGRLVSDQRPRDPGRQVAGGVF